MIRQLLLKFNFHLLIYAVLYLKGKLTSSDIKVISNNPIATTSDDHKFPVGTINDNFATKEFIEEYTRVFSKKSFLDLGCAGGQLVVSLNNLGITAVGIEGSSKCLVGRGRKNWYKLNHKILFFSDITKEFFIMKHKKILKFDIIHAEEVLEHIHETDLTSTLRNIVEHMTNDSLLLLGICKNSDKRFSHSANIIDLHKSNLTLNRWEQIFANHNLVPQREMPTLKGSSGWPLVSSNRSDETNSLFFGLRKKS